MTQTHIIVWVAFGLAQIADVLTTRAALQRGLSEAHPLWRWMQDRLGKAWWFPRLALAGALAGGLHWWSGSILPVAVIAAGIFGIAGWNMAQIRRSL